MNFGNIGKVASAARAKQSPAAVAGTLSLGNWRIIAKLAAFAHSRVLEQKRSPALVAASAHCRTLRSNKQFIHRVVLKTNLQYILAGTGGFLDDLRCIIGQRLRCRTLQDCSSTNPGNPATIMEKDFSLTALQGKASLQA